LRSEIFRRLAEAIFRESLLLAIKPDARISLHLDKQKDWERETRTACRALVESARADGRMPSEDDLAKLAQRINSFYHARLPRAGLAYFAEGVRESVQMLRWWGPSQPPDVLTSADVQAIKIAEVVTSAMESTCQGMSLVTAATFPRPQRPYALVTKVLHFLFPSSFPIYDWQVTQSINAVALCAYSTRVELRPFRKTLVSATGGSGYREGIVDFYRLLWMHTTSDQHDRLRENAASLSHYMDCWITVHDLIDKLLWIADGNLEILICPG